MSAAEPAGPAQTQEITGDDDVVRVRQLVRAAAVATRLSLVDQTKLVTAASELARNTLTHGGGGRVEVETVTGGRRTGVRVLFVDEGPGIANVDLALTDGYSTGTGLGLGLFRRQVEELSGKARPCGWRRRGGDARRGP